MEDGEAVAEPGAEARHRLRGEADLGDEDDRAAAALERRLDRGQVDLGLARAGDAVQELLARGAGLAVEGGDDRRRPRPRCSGSSCGTARPGPRGRSRPGRGAARELRVAIRPRSSSRRRIWRSEPTAAASSPPTSRPPRSASSTARCLTPEPPTAAQRRLAGRQDLGPQLDSWSGPCAPPVPVPGGSTSCRPREGVEQYSRATQRPSRPAPAGRPPPAPRSAPPAAPAAAPRSRRARRRRRAAAAARTARGRRCRPRDPPSPPAGGSRTGPAERGRWSAARP